MPYAVTHILFPIVLVSLFRDFILKNKNKKKFPLHYVLIAGVGGVLPDIDIIFSVLLSLLGTDNWWVHKTITHSLLFPVFLLILFVATYKVNANAKICNLTKHKLKLSLIFLFLSVGVLIHIFLDGLLGSGAYLFYPFSNYDFSLDLFNYLPKELHSFSFPLLDGILLTIWIVYLELKHKISDFI